MELSDEQKKRIFEEEQQKAAEEQYRTTVRSKLQQTVSSPPAQPARKHWSFLKTLALVAISAVAVVIVANLAFNSANKATASGRHTVSAICAAAPLCPRDNQHRLGASRRAPRRGCQLPNHDYIGHAGTSGKRDFHCGRRAGQRYRSRARR
jgi:hypothetical protein